MYISYYLDGKFVDEIIDIINKYDGEFDRDEGICTIKGDQTRNIVNLFEQKTLKKIIPIQNLSENIFYLHHIKYNKGGSQERHDHPRDQYSFILYLNDADGDTVFETPINKRVTPEKGKLIVFDAKILHYALPSFKGKEVLVGAIK